VEIPFSDVIPNVDLPTNGDVDEVVQFQPVTNGTRRRDMAGFIQFIEFEATDIDAVAATLERFRDENPGALTASASTITEDRDRPGTYISIVEFPSYEKAMEQQRNPATSAFSASLAEVMSGAPRFRNLDVRSVLTNP
jgi:quinol monooxygenase YgiN